MIGRHGVAERIFKVLQPATLELSLALLQISNKNVNDSISYESFQREQPLCLTDDQRTLIRQLAQNIPAIWHAPETTSQLDFCHLSQIHNV